MASARARRLVVAVCLVVSVLFIIAAASEVFIAERVKPRTTTGYLLLTVLLSGLGGGLILETMGVRVRA